LPNWFRREPKPAAAVASRGIEIGQPWARAALQVRLQAGGFFVVTNKGALPDRLVAASSPVAEKVEIHAIKVVGADIQMCPRPEGLLVEAGSTLTLKPRGYHLLLSGVATALVVGTRLPVTLTFERAGRIDVELTVEAAGLVGEEILNEEHHRG
jgi:periplasmic copper chaperone A